MNTEDKKIISAEGEIEDARGTMRKKIVLLVLLFLCVGALITLVIIRAGTPMVDFWTVAGSLSRDKSEIASIERLEAVSGERKVAKGRLALYEYENDDGKKVQAVVHLLSGKTVAAFTDTDSLAYTVSLNAALGEAAWCAVLETALSDAPTYALSLLDENGTVFASKSEIDTLSALNALCDPVLDLVRFEQSVYRVEKNGSARLAFTLSAFADLPVLDEKVGDRYYHVESDLQGVDCWYVYDKDAQLCAIYRVPTEAKDARAYILSDGTIFSQYVTAEDASAAQYTFMKDGVKYKLHHEVISARTGEKTVIKDPDFYIAPGEQSVISDDERMRAFGLNASMENLARGYRISDHILDMNAHALKAALLSNRGKITSFVGDIIPAMDQSTFVGVAKNRWVARNLADEYFLLNEWGYVIGRFPSLATAADTALAAEIFVHQKKIYDWDLDLLYDMEENDVIDFELVGSSVLMRKAEGEVLLYDGEKQSVTVLSNKGEEKKIETRSSSLIFVEQTVEEKKQIDVYNEGGTLLITLEADSVEVYTSTLDGRYVAELLVKSGESTALYLAVAED
ncbi:MAG: hypothetical protein IKA53_05910 [Clostridia bacterium]|nr:hypothetical protein [Clostridia bacterium]